MLNEDRGSRGSCRFCRTPLRHTFVDLGMAPLCESYLTSEQLDEMEPYYPVHPRVCERCFLVQLDQYVAPEIIFSEYGYFSSYSESWLKHARDFAAIVVQRFGLHSESSVIEIGSNDGYLLQNFVARGIPALGIEPAANIAKSAMEKGVPTRVAFFGAALARQLSVEGKMADLLIANNVLAQVPDLNDFVEGIRLVLKATGVATIEVAYLPTLIERIQYDTIYHEHFSYFSFTTLDRIFSYHELTVFDVEELPTHGGSIRVYARPAQDRAKPVSENVDALRKRERAEGIELIGSYSGFSDKVAQSKRNLLDFLIKAKRQGKRIAGYGAPGKGSTLLNYCGIRSDFLDYTVDRNPFKQGKFLPGSHLPIFPPEKIYETRPDYLLVLPWNLKDEICGQMASVREWGGRFVLPIPAVEVYS